MKVKTDTPSPFFPGTYKEVWRGQKPCKGEQGSLLVLVSMVSTALSWLLLALQMLIIGVKCWGQDWDPLRYHASYFV